MTINKPLPYVFSKADKMQDSGATYTTTIGTTFFDSLNNEIYQENLTVSYDVLAEANAIWSELTKKLMTLHKCAHAVGLFYAVWPGITSVSDVKETCIWHESVLTPQSTMCCKICGFKKRFSNLPNVPRKIDGRRARNKLESLQSVGKYFKPQCVKRIDIGRNRNQTNHHTLQHLSRRLKGQCQ